MGKIKTKIIFALMIVLASSQAWAQNTIYSNDFANAADAGSWQERSNALWEPGNNGEIRFSRGGTFIISNLPEGITNATIYISALYGDFLMLHTSQDGADYTEQGLFTGSTKIETASKTIPNGTRYLKFKAKDGAPSNICLISVKITGNVSKNVGKTTTSPPTPTPPTQTYRLDVEPNDAALGSVSGSGSYKAGEKVTLTAAPKEDAEFENWTMDGSITGKGTKDEVEYVFEMPAKDVKITGNFDEKKYFLKVVSNDTDLGTVSTSIGTAAGSSYKADTRIIITATPKEGAKFVHWTEKDQVISTNATYNYIMPKRQTQITGVFKPQIKGGTSTTITSDPPPSPPKLGGTSRNDSVSKSSLMLTSNLWCAELSGGGNYVVGSLVNVSATAPAEYKFEGWYLVDKLESEKANFTYTINRISNVCLHAVYSNPSKPPIPPVFDGKYARSVWFFDNNIPLNPDAKMNMLATGYMEFRPKTKDLWSPYFENNWGILTFDFDTINYNVWNENFFGKSRQRPGFFALTIYEVTDKEIIAGSGGYLFGSEVLKFPEKFSRVYRIPYILNEDGSITLKNFNITAKEGQPAYDITFYPAPNANIEKETLWFTKREATVYDDDPYEVYVNAREWFWNIIREEVVPNVLKQLKK